MDLTILIPTMNRHEFLTRVLEYYKSVGFDGWIIIGDSSNDECLRKNMNLVTATKELNIIHRIYPNPPYLHIGMCIKEMNKEISTNYAVFQGDDDFLIPSALQQCIDFLEQSSDEFTTAHGKRITIKIMHNKPYGDLNYIYDDIRKQDLINDNVFKRWQEYVKVPFSNQYWVHRANVWKRAYEKADLIPDRYLGPEFLPCSLTILSGKAKELDCVSLICQSHQGDTFNFNDTSLFDLTCMDTWTISIKNLKQILIDNGLPLDIVHAGLWCHLALFLTIQYQRRYGETKQNLNTGIPEDNKINNIKIKPSSRWLYYKEFLPIFNFLTKHNG